MPKAAPLASIAVSVLLLTACGGSEETEPKRAVDARTEAIHFFPADQPFLAFLDTSTQSGPEISRNLRALDDLPALNAFAAGGGAFVRESGLELGRLAPLLTDEEPEDGISASQAAYGVAPGGGGSETLMILVSEQVEEMEAKAEAAATAAGMTEGEEVDSARVFSDRQAALAIRDGVVVVSPDLPSLQAAIALRDADQDDQLDEDQVSAALADLPAAPLVAYATPAALIAADPGLLEVDSSFLSSTKEAGIAVTPGVAHLRIDVVAKVEPDEIVPAAELGDAEIDETEARRIVGARRAAGNEFRDAIIALAPFAARASVSEDELRATILSPR